MLFLQEGYFYSTVQYSTVLDKKNDSFYITNSWHHDTNGCKQQSLSTFSQDCSNTRLIAALIHNIVCNCCVRSHRLGRLIIDIPSPDVVPVGVMWDHLWWHPNWNIIC